MVVDPHPYAVAFVKVELKTKKTKEQAKENRLLSKQQKRQHVNKAAL